MRRLLVVLTLFATVSVSAPFAQAQLLIPGAASPLIISLSPTSPKPGEQVRLNVTSTLYDLRDSDITWRAGGTVIMEGIGATEARVTAGGLGSVTTVTVSAAHTDGGVASASVNITPAQIDLLWESDSYTPPLYRGRALAGAGTSVRVIAIPHLVRPNGTEIPVNQITFTWRKNGTVLGSLSGRGRSLLFTSSPMLFDADTISVEAIATDRSISATNSVRINSEKTPLRLYQDHPLFGRLFHQALGASTPISESEMTFEAIPYFASVRTVRDRALEYNWEVNRVAVTPDANAPNTITINAEGSTGIAIIDLSVFHSTNLFFEANGNWEVNFRSTGAGGSDPFSARQ